MRNRAALQTILETLLESDAVYFQPPPSVKMVYPCIVYERTSKNGNTKFADNDPYLIAKEYTVTLIDKDPDSAIHDKIANLRTCTFDRHFTADNLNHDVFSLFF